MGSRLRVLGAGLVVGMGALVLAPSAWAGGTWAYSSADHTQLQINFQTDNGQNAYFEVFTLSVPVRSATCPGGGAGALGQPDNNPDEFECQLSPVASSGAVTVTTDPEPCNAAIANKASFDNFTYSAQNPIMPTANNCPAASPAAPVASFTPPNATVAQPVTFDATASHDPNPGGSITRYEWNFGDGSAMDSGAKVSHTFIRSGQFPVTLTVTDAEGGTASSAQLVVVETALQPLTVGSPSTSSSTVTLPVECSVTDALFHGNCFLLFLLAALGGGAPTSGHASNLAIAASCHTSKHCPKLLVVGETKVKIRARHTKHVRIKLDRAGRRLLAKKHVLKVKLTITESGHTLSTRKIVFRSKPAKKHH